jgi:hypothetical protein
MRSRTWVTFIAAALATACSSGFEHRAMADAGEGQQLPAGSRARVRIGGRWVVGTYVGQSRDSLRFAVQTYHDETPPFAFSGKAPTGERDTLAWLRSSIEEFQVSSGHRSHGGTGVLVGAVVGGGAGLGLGVALASDEFFQAGSGTVVATTVIGAVAGCLLGGIIGSLVRTEHWERMPPPSVSIGPIGTKAEFTMAFTIPFP